MSCCLGNLWFDPSQFPCGIPAQWPAWEQRPVWPPCPPPYPPCPPPYPPCPPPYPPCPPPCPPCPPGPPAPHGSHAFKFTTDTQVVGTTAPNFSFIKFDAASGEATNDIAVVNGNLVFAHGGIYKITYVIEFPTTVANNIGFAHQLGTVTVEGSGITTHTGTTDYAGEEIVKVEAGQTLSLVATFPAGVTSQTVNFASIAVEKIDD